MTGKSFYMLISRKQGPGSPRQVLLEPPREKLRKVSSLPMFRLVDEFELAIFVLQESDIGCPSRCATPLGLFAIGPVSAEPSVTA